MKSCLLWWYVECLTIWLLYHLYAKDGSQMRGLYGRHADNTGTCSLYIKALEEKI